MMAVLGSSLGKLWVSCRVRGSTTRKLGHPCNSHCQPRQRLQICGRIRGRIPFPGDGSCVGLAARGKGAGAGIGWFAAKRGEVSDGRARGIEVEMDGGLLVSESPLAPLKVGDQRVPWPVSARHWNG